MEDLARWSASPCSPTVADGLSHELGIPLELAAILIRRGLSDAQEARRFLAADEQHDPALLGDVAQACDLVIDHLERGSRIVVHGDYDVDGVCSTAILVGVLRDLGGDPAWHIPNRLEDGYGLTESTVDRLVGAGTGLLITVDCGITCAAEIDRARAGGIDSVVCDHHRPGDRLPDCPILHPALGGYPFADLCASAVAHKFALALRVAGGIAGPAHDELDLVALATICDVVPLRGENRRLVRDGLEVLRRTQRPGLRALMRVAGLEPGQLDERAAAFRLGPRINAAGRMQTAEAALELMLTSDDRRSGEIADELDLLNRARRDEETRVLFSAESARGGREEDRAIVVAGEGWHPGVLGIVASRLAERHGRPALVIAFEDGVGRGSGRSWGAFDLHAALSECALHLRRFGGHRAAAGVELEAVQLEAFRTAFESIARSRIDERDLALSAEADAVVSPARLDLELAESLRLLAPFGAANRQPILVTPGVSVEDVRPMGGDGQHSGMALVGGGARARSVAFRRTPRSMESRTSAPQDVVLTLEIDRWGGSVSARPILSGMVETPSGWVVDAAAGEGFMDRVRALARPVATVPARGETIDRR
ncbi:MAG: single-stranded-DNA-specific exonuclease RecJ, partial [Thermoleophilaceae bacterium]|nr:single-stranded-DNA-specific exonuclease RecJ [Thermoleophilaceae bacterium]